MDAGGAETFLMKLFRQLDTSKFMMDFCVTVDRRCFYDDEIERRGGKIYHITPKSSNVKAFKKQLFDVVKNNGYENVLRITSNSMGFMDLKIAKKAGAKNCAARSSNSSDGGSFKALAAHRIGRVLYTRYVDVKFAPSTPAAEYTFGKKACEKGEVTLLPNAIDLNVFRFDSEGRNAVRKEFGIAEDTAVMGHIGRFTKQKNHAFLIDVFEKFHKNTPNSVLMLTGKGELEDGIKNTLAEKGLSDSVIFTGIRPDVPQLLSAMDVFVFPSFYEGMPNTVIEAQAAGLPCVVADTVTKEAALTPLVSFKKLSDTPDDWARAAAEAIGKERPDTRSELAAAGYDITVSAQKFAGLVFG